ncbi:hypothetical protein K1719_000993 [Acacia pycnantha]|nr:hypothetical protein K1719_000993 [Acacia pycnantha]
MNFEAEIKRTERLNKNLLSLRSLKQVKQLQEEFLQLENISEVDEQEAPDNVVGVEMGTKADQIKTRKQEFDATQNKQTQQKERKEINEIMEADEEGRESLVEVMRKPK